MKLLNQIKELIAARFPDTNPDEQFSRIQKNIFQSENPIEAANHWLQVLNTTTTTSDETQSIIQTHLQGLLITEQNTNQKINDNK